tara:strand:+ start:95 stop:676 length:582 start_codon:yes stop_codon:yes gene_type:complete
MALDIETSNYSWQIGGWGNTHLFEPTVVCTWDGEEGHVFSKEHINSKDMVWHALHPKSLGDHLQKHVESGGKILGHNLMGFDLPVLRDALDCHYAGRLMASDDVIDTSALLRSSTGMAHHLDDLCKHTLGVGKTQKSEDAPRMWEEGQHKEVAEYCLKDCQLVYDVWNHGKNEGFVKSRNQNTGAIDNIEVIW